MNCDATLVCKEEFRRTWLQRTLNKDEASPLQQR